jgi:hypothetical protein
MVSERLQQSESELERLRASTKVVDVQAIMATVPAAMGEPGELQPDRHRTSSGDHPRGRRQYPGAPR